MARRARKRYVEPQKSPENSDYDGSEEGECSNGDSQDAKANNNSTKTDASDSDHQEEKTNNVEKESKQNTKNDVNKKKSKKNSKLVFEVQEIVGMEINNRWRCPVKFRVRWVGYKENDDTWIPLHNLSCDKLIEEFLQISGRKPEYERALEKFLKPITGGDRYDVSLRKSRGPLTYEEQDSEGEDETLFTKSTRTRNVRVPEQYNPSDLPPQHSKGRKPKKSQQSNSKQTSNSSSQAKKAPEVERIIGYRMKGKVKECKVRWKGLGSSHDSWVPASSINAKKIKNEPEEEYEVASIIDSKETDDTVLYKVRWKGFSAKYDSWLPRDEMNCPQLVSKFENALQKLVQKEDWVVNKIKAKRVVGGKVEYLVHWSGFESKHDTWEPQNNLTGCQDKVDEFLAKQQSKNVKRNSSPVDDSDVMPAKKKRVSFSPGTPSGSRMRRQSAQVSYLEDDDSD